MNYAIFSNSTYFINAISKKLKSNCKLIVYSKDLKEILDADNVVPNDKICNYTDLASKEHILKGIDIILCFNFIILPKKILKIPNVACINFHPANLPEYAGRYPWPMLKEDNVKENYVTAHLMQSVPDSGHVLFTSKYQLNPSDDYQDWNMRIESKVVELSNKILSRERYLLFRKYFGANLFIKRAVKVPSRSKIATRKITSLELLHIFNIIKINKYLGGTLINLKTGNNFVIYDATFLHEKNSETKEGLSPIFLKCTNKGIFLTDGSGILKLLSYKGLDLGEKLEEIVL